MKDQKFYIETEKGIECGGVEIIPDGSVVSFRVIDTNEFNTGYKRREYIFIGEFSYWCGLKYRSKEFKVKLSNAKEIRIESINDDNGHPLYLRRWAYADSIDEYNSKYSEMRPFSLDVNFLPRPQKGMVEVWIKAR